MAKNFTEEEQPKANQLFEEANAAQNTGDFEQAIKMYNQFIELSSDYYAARGTRGAIKTSFGNMQMLCGISPKSWNLKSILKWGNWFTKQRLLEPIRYVSPIEVEKILRNTGQ